MSALAKKGGSRDEEWASETVSNAEEVKEAWKKKRTGSHPPPPSSATPLPPCAEPDKVALIKICHFSFQKNTVYAINPPLWSICHRNGNFHI